MAAWSPLGKLKLVNGVMWAWLILLAIATHFTRSVILLVLYGLTGFLLFVRLIGMREVRCDNCRRPAVHSIPFWRIWIGVLPAHARCVGCGAELSIAPVPAEPR